MYRWLVRPVLFAFPPGAAHGAAMTALAPVEYVAPLRAAVRGLMAPVDPRLAVRRMGIDFPSPVGLAAGFDKNAVRPRALAALGFGHLELGTVTAEPQEANPEPNQFRLPRDRALVNRLGFPNEGALAVATRLGVRRLGGGIGVPVGLSIGKSRRVPLEPLEGAVADYVASYHFAQAAADFIVVNVSSPNTPDLRAMQGAEIARTLLGALAAERDRGERRVPTLLKIAPDLTDAELEALLAVVAETKLDGVVATNTTVSRAGLATPAAEVDAIGAGGLSGAPLKRRAREVVRRVRARLGPSVTVIGVGGVETGADAVALMRAGADLVQLYTGFIYRGPWTPRLLATEILAEVTREGARSVSELTGAAVG